jgi:GST-like protein
MLEVWSWPTPNGHKVHIALGARPSVQGDPDQHRRRRSVQTGFLKIAQSPHSAIVDSDGPGGKPFTLFDRRRS